MKLQYLFTAFYFLFILSSCGYHLTSSAPIVLPDNIRTLSLVEVINPSTESWLEPYLRSSLRDEFIRRGQVEWVDRFKAKGLLEIDIKTWSSSTMLENANDQTVKSEVILRFKGRIFKKTDHNLLWESRLIEVREPYVGQENNPQKQSAEQRAIDLGVERLADQLSQDF